MARPAAGVRVMARDLAGGGLAAATLMAARDARIALPDKAILICPWLQIAPDHPDQAHIELRDAILTRQGLRAAGMMYAGASGMHDSRASPLRGDWAGPPPLLVFGGSDDILVTDARTLKSRLSEVIYDEREGMMHDWPILFFSESRDAQASMAVFSSPRPNAAGQAMDLIPPTPVSN